jgi:hypothetical protein
MEKGTNPGWSEGGAMHSISEDERNFPLTTVVLNLHLMFLVS